MKNEELNKREVQQIDNKIDVEKNKIKELNNVYDEIEVLSRNMNKCIDLLADSVKGPVANNIFNDAYESNIVFCRNTSNRIDEEMGLSKKIISNLSEEKESILKSKKGDEDADSGNKEE